MSFFFLNATGSTGVRKAQGITVQFLTLFPLKQYYHCHSCFHHATLTGLRNSSFWAVPPIIWPLTLAEATEDSKKAVVDTWGWCRDKLQSYAMYKTHVSELAQLWEIVSSHLKPLGPLALTHVRLDKQTHAQERTSSAVFLCLSVMKAKL